MKILRSLIPFAVAAAFVLVAAFAIMLTIGTWVFSDTHHSETVQIEMRPQSPPQPRRAPYEFEFKRAEEMWNRDHIAYVPDRHYVRRSHKLTHEAANACYDKDGKQITPIPKGCTDLFIERDK